MRVEPSLQAAFVDYGGNKHGFLAFGEIHPDYYNVSEEELASIDKEVDEIIEAKKQAIKEREAERERHRAEKAAQYAAREEERKAREAAEAEAKAAAAAENGHAGFQHRLHERLLESVGAPHLQQFLPYRLQRDARKGESHHLSERRVVRHTLHGGRYFGIGVRTQAVDSRFFLYSIHNLSHFPHTNISKYI